VRQQRSQLAERLARLRALLGGGAAELPQLSVERREHAQHGEPRPPRRAERIVQPERRPRSALVRAVQRDCERHRPLRDDDLAEAAHAHAGLARARIPHERRPGQEGQERIGDRDHEHERPIHHVHRRTHLPVADSRARAAARLT
jgi:hypothetical protein